MLGPIGIFFVIFFSLLIVFAILGVLQIKRNEKQNLSQEDEDFFSMKVVENVHDLNDRFNRARYMDHDEDQR